MKKTDTPLHENLFSKGRSSGMNHSRFVYIACFTRDNDGDGSDGDGSDNDKLIAIYYNTSLKVIVDIL